MIDQFNTLIPEEFRNEQKEIIEKYSYHNEQNNNFTTKDDLEIIQFLQSPGWSLISQNDVNLPLINQTINSINTQENRNNNFSVRNQARGRKRKSNSENPTHGKDSFDNVQRKLQVHFINFITNFCNDAIRYYLKTSSFSFKNINKKAKIEVNFNNVSKLKKCSIKDLLNSEISTKYKNWDKNENKKLLLKLKGTCLDGLLEMNYLDLFKLYYNNNKESRLKEINFGKDKIPLSEKTKSFCFLLRKNQDIKEKIVEVAEIIYLSDNDNDGSLFSTKTYA